ncbi:MAG: hypothetical protein JWR19_1200 [Pedosphaera sp.]|nr:hypothetical protein [Pedosphaera sp.]
MKWLFRWAFRLLILLLVLLVAGILLLDTILRSMAEREIRSATGMEVTIGSLSVGLFSPVITIENFKLYNTAEFGGSPFIDIPELHVEYDRRALFSRKLQCKLVRFNLAEVNVVQNKQGRMNTDTIQAREQKAANANRPANQKGGSGFALTGIQTLNLSLGRVTMLNMNNPSQVKQLNLNIRNQVIPDIKNEQDLELRIFLIIAQNGGLKLYDFFPRNSAAPGGR